MTKIISKARILRWEYARKQGRKVTALEVAEKSGVSYPALTRIERGETEAIDFNILARLCAFYGVGVGDILEYDPNGIQTPEQVAA